MPDPTRKHPTVKLTKAVVDRLAPRPKEYFAWDSQDKGFAAKVSPSGKITFIVQGRLNPTSPPIRIIVGPYGTFTPDQAREVAREHLRSMRQGQDPRDLRRKTEAQRVTLRQVADRYFARGLLKEGTRRDMDRHIETAFVAWKDRPIASITPDECRKFYERISAKGLRGKPAPSAATLYMTTFRTLANFAMEEFRQLDGTPIIARNPVAILKRDMKPSPPRTRHIDRRQIGQFWNWLAQARDTAQGDDAVAAVDLLRFLTLTGARKMEGAALEWRNVHLDDNPAECWWHIEDPKNKNPIWLPLSSHCAAVLQERKRLNDRAPRQSAFVFPSRSKTGHLMDARAPLARFAATINMQGLSPHDLRRTFVTLGVKACRLDIAKLELLTNHVPQGITAKHYLETSDLRDYHAEVQAIADFIESEARIEAAKASGANVVQLPQRA